MGGNCSCYGRNNTYSKYPELKQWQPEFEALKLTPYAVKRLYKLFKKIDTDGSGSIQVDELLDFIDLERNKFSERVFSIFDHDGSKCIDFKEFTIALWNYCTLGNTTLLLFAFDLYDKDASGVIGAVEVDLMLKEIYGTKFQKNIHAQRISEKIGNLSMEDVNTDIFVEFIRNHPALIYPAFTMQQLIQTKCMGKRFWKEVSKRRVELAHGHFLSVDEIVNLLNHAVMEKKVEKNKNMRTFEIETILESEEEKKQTIVTCRRGRNKDSVRDNKKDNRRGSTNSITSTTSNTDTLSESSPMKHIDFVPAPVGSHKKRQSFTQSLLSMDSADRTSTEKSLVSPFKRESSKSGSRRGTFPTGDSSTSIFDKMSKPRAGTYEDLAISSFNDEDCHIAPLKTDLSRRMSSHRLKPRSQSTQLSRDLSRRGSSKKFGVGPYDRGSSFNGSGSPCKKKQILPEPQVYYKDLSRRISSESQLDDPEPPFHQQLSRRMSSTRMSGMYDGDSSSTLKGINDEKKKNSKKRRHSDASIPSNSDIEKLVTDSHRLRRVSIY